MKKIIKKLITTFYLIPIIATAAINSPSKPAGVADGSPQDFIKKISEAILSLVVAVAILFIIIGAISYVTSAGNPDQVSKAKNTIFYAIIGIIVAILSYVIVNFVIGTF